MTQAAYTRERKAKGTGLQAVMLADALPRQMRETTYKGVKGSHFFRKEDTAVAELTENFSRPRRSLRPAYVCARGGSRKHKRTRSPDMY